MAESSMNVPSGMGGLMRYNEEYPSRLMFSPVHVIIFIAAVVVGMIILKFLF